MKCHVSALDGEHTCLFWIEWETFAHAEMIHTQKNNENKKRAYSQPIMKNVSISFFSMILRMAVAAINIFYRCDLFIKSITHFQKRLEHLLSRMSLFYPLATMFLVFILGRFWCEHKKTSVLQRVCQDVCSTHVNLGSIRLHRFVFLSPITYARNEEVSSFISIKQSTMNWTFGSPHAVYAIYIIMHVNWKTILYHLNDMPL